MSLAARKTEIPETGYPHVDATLRAILNLAWTPVDDVELARIVRAHRSAVKSAEIEDSFQEPDEIALFQALHDLRCPVDIRSKAVGIMFDELDKARSSQKR